MHELTSFVSKEMHNNKAPTLSVHRIHNAFPLCSIIPNDSVQACWNDLQLSFFATLIFWCLKPGLYKNTIFKNEAPSLKLFLCKYS